LQRYDITLFKTIFSPRKPVHLNQNALKPARLNYTSVVSDDKWFLLHGVGESIHKVYPEMVEFEREVTGNPKENLRSKAYKEQAVNKRSFVHSGAVGGRHDALRDFIVYERNHGMGDSELKSAALAKALELGWDEQDKIDRLIQWGLSLPIGKQKKKKKGASVTGNPNEGMVCFLGELLWMGCFRRANHNEFKIRDLEKQPLSKESYDQHRKFNHRDRVILGQLISDTLGVTSQVVRRGKKTPRIYYGLQFKEPTDYDLDALYEEIR
jgi:hypothetical protein